MARTSTTPDEILKRVLVRLKAQVDGASDANVYVSTVSNELPPNPAEVMFEVSFAHNFSVFDPEFTGAGNEGMHTVMSLMVTISTVVQLDEVGHDLHYLTHTSYGMCKHMTNVLKALSNHDLLDASDNQILAQPLRPEQGQIPPKDDRRRGYVTLMFGCEFDWNLS